MSYEKAARKANDEIMRYYSDEMKSMDFRHGFELGVLDELTTDKNLTEIFMNVARMGDWVQLLHGSESGKNGRAAGSAFVRRWNGKIPKEFMYYLLGTIA